MMFENVDLAQIVLYLFWIFFAGLLIYLRREDRREGYPLESDVMPGRMLKKSIVFFPAPKTFAMSHGSALRTVPTGLGDARPIAAQPVARWPGAPLQPTDPMPLLAGVGPGAYAERADVPDMTVENHTKIVPLRVAPAYAPAKDGPDPRGYTVYGLDRGVAGVVTDLWVDRSECVLRYLEVQLSGATGDGARPTAGTPTPVGVAPEAQPAPATASTAGVVPGVASPAPMSGVVPAAGSSTRRVLVPVNFANIHSRRGRVTVKAIVAGQFGMAPTPSSPDQITMLEEEKIQAFFGAGMLYATPLRAEPLL